MGTCSPALYQTAFALALRWAAIPDIGQTGGKMRHWVLFVSLIVAGQAGSTHAALAQHISGVNPATRPEGAPIITEIIKDGDWYTRALSGVTSPYPASLKFLEDQGAWFNPFIHPGMLGPYDIRGWHDQQ